MNRQSQAYLFAGLTVLFWGTVATAFKIALDVYKLAPVELLLFASCTSLWVLFCILLFQKKLSLLRQYTWRQLVWSLLLGALNPFLYYLVLFEAYDRLPAQEALAINHSWPVMLVLLSIPILKQRITRLELLSTLLGYSGVFIIATRGNVLSLQFDNPKGVGCALASTFIWAIYWLMNAQSRHDPVVCLFLNFLFGVPLVMGYYLIGENHHWPTTPGLLAAGYVGLFEMGLTFVCWLSALRLTESTAKITNIIFLTPVLSLICIYFVLQEPLQLTTLIGLAMILIGLSVQKWAKQSSEK